MRSPAFSFENMDWRKILIGAAVAVVGALLTYISAWLAGADFGAWTPLVAAVWAIITNVARKFIAENES